MITKEIDFRLTKDKPAIKTFGFTNADGTPYSMTGSSVVCELYITETPETISCTVDLPTGNVTIHFLEIHTATVGIFEYVVIETKDDASVIHLIKGNSVIEPYIPFSESIEGYLNSELPANLTLTLDYRLQRITYWRRFLQSAFSISDANINTESAWPTLVNALIAKLVVHDALMLAARGSYISFFGGDYTSADDLGGPIKKIETGPSNVEFHSASSAISDIFTVNASGQSPFEYFSQGICGLANKLGIKVPMCSATTIRISPTFAKNSSWEYPTLLEWYNQSISQG